MRVLDPSIHRRESICDFLTANGINPNRVPLQRLFYDGRKREIHFQHFVEVDGVLQLTPGKTELLRITAIHRVRRGHEPSKYVGK